MPNISGFGLTIYCIASSTLPSGFTIDQFADDADPFDIPELTIAETTMGLNGEILVASRAVSVPITLAVIPQSDNDVTLGILMQANMVGLGKTGARDEITLVGTYPDGRVVTLTSGAITAGMPGNSVASAGRLKSKTYSFSFGTAVWE